MRKRLTNIAMIVIAVVVVSACSPENGRPRAGGPGGMSDNIPAGGVVPRSKVFSSEDPG